NRLLREIVGGRGVQARRHFDPPTQILHVDAWLPLHEHEGHQISLLADKRDGLAITGEDDGEGLERWRRFGDADDLDSMIIQLERASETQGYPGEEKHVAGSVDDDRVRLT